MPNTAVKRLRFPGLVAVAGLLAVATAASPVYPAAAEYPDPAASAPYLPAPTGPHPVGTRSLHLTDESRQDPWVPEAGARELMVSLWYPAKSRGERRAEYVTPKESELLLTAAGITGVPPEVLSWTRTNAYTDVKPAGGKRPLVVLSPGMSWLRTSLTSVAEELASRGYVVASIDHTYESHATTFPDGRITICEACLRGIENFPTLAVESRARDVSFVLDQLTRSPMVDRSRIAMAGMSLGGASVGETMLTDPRVRAGINLDGTNFKPLPDSGLSRPFMFFGAPAEEPSWVRDWPRLTGWKRWLTMTGSVHSSFTDYDMLMNQVGVDLGSALPGTRSVVITRAYVHAFFELHLRGIPQPLLEQPSTRYPEVRFCAPDTNTCP